MLPPGAMPQQPGFLSDQLEPIPQPGSMPWNGPAIITDQP
jgi:hypothetical protein